MSTEQSSEGLTNDVEGQKELTVEDLQSKMQELTATLEAEKSSKERILAESKKYKEGYQNFKAEKEEIARLKAQADEEKLREKGQYDVLLKQREERLKELESELNSYKSEVQSRDEAILNFKKAAAFEKELGGKLKKDAYWSHVDFESIAIDPNTGKIDSHSLNKVAESFKSDFNELVDYGNIGNLPNSNPQGSGKLTYAQWQKLPLKERKQRMKDVAGM